FVDPRANQSAFPAIQNERGKCASRKVLGDLPLCLCLGNDVRDHRRPSRKPLGNTGTNLLALLGKFGSKITQQAAATELLFFSHLNQMDKKFKSPFAPASMGTSALPTGCHDALDAVGKD